MGSNEDNISFWKGMWAEGHVVIWHKTDVNPTLLSHQGHLGSDEPMSGPISRRILVPLCGKTLDMIFLNQELGFKVIGVDGVEEAINTFGCENHIELDRKNIGDNWVQFMSKGDDYQLLMGDFFHLKPEVINGSDPIRFVYDRASLIAIRPEQRGVYVDAIKRVIDMNNFRYLLIVMEYDTTIEGAKGPPYCVTEGDVTSLFKSWGSIEKLSCKSLPNFKLGKGRVDVGNATEVVYLIKNK